MPVDISAHLSESYFTQAPIRDCFRSLGRIPQSCYQCVGIRIIVHNHQIPHYLSVQLFVAFLYRELFFLFLERLGINHTFKG